MDTTQGSSEIRTVHVKNDKFRIKTTNQCNMNCWFCHKEGIHTSKDVVLDQAFSDAILRFREVFNRVHLTGGEPFLYPHLSEMLRFLSSAGYKISITTNGSIRLRDTDMKLLDLLSYVNVSFHSTEPEYYNTLTGQDNGQFFVDRIRNNIQEIRKTVPVRINTVVGDNVQSQKLVNMIHFAQEMHCELKFVPELKVRLQAMRTIDELIKAEGYILQERVLITPGSNLRERFINQSGHCIEIKKLQPYHPRELCKKCKLAGNCPEGFSFFRIGGNPLYAQTCINAEPMDYYRFLKEKWQTLRDEML